MKARKRDLHASRLLTSATARDLMTPNPRSMRQTMSVEKAAEVLSAAGIGAAPVIDEAGRPVGVVSRTDVLRHLGRPSDFESSVSLAGLADGLRERGGVPVSQIMTRAVFSVRPEAPAAKIIAKMLALEVRRLFVVDRHGLLIGVVSVFDLLRALAPPAMVWDAADGVEHTVVSRRGPGPRGQFNGFSKPGLEVQACRL